MSRAILALAALVVVAASPAPTTAHAQAVDDPAATEQTVLAAEGEAVIATVDIGGAGLVLPAGIARATLAGDIAQASANAVDYALAATLFGVLVGEGTEFPGPVKATSDGPPQDSRTTTLPALGPVPPLVLGPVRAGATTEEAQVGTGPSAGSRTQLSPVRLAAAATIAGATATTDLTPEGAEARASIGELRLTDLLVLRGVEWWAEAGPGRAPSAGFRVGALEVAGVTVPLGPAGLDGTAVSQLLGTLGVRVDTPQVTVDGPRAEVSPLVVRYADSPLAAGTIGEVYAALSPTLIELFNTIQAGAPEAGYLLYVSNIVLASVAGLGELRVELGGAAASYEVRTFTDPAPSDHAVDSPGVTPPPPAPPPSTDPAPPPAAPPAAPAEVAAPEVAPPATPRLAATPVAGRRLDDRVPDAVVAALVLGGLAGAALLVAGRRRQAAGGTSGAAS